MSHDLHPAVAALLERRRLGSLDASRHRFTVSREAALLRLREQARERAKAIGEEEWGWTLYLVRAANALSELAEAWVSLAEDEGNPELEVVSIDLLAPGLVLPSDGDATDDPATPGASKGLIDLSDLLAGALEPDLGEPLDPVLVDRDLRLRRFRMLLGRALNGALATDPVAVELLTGAGGRRFERREQVAEDRDPYGERRLPGLNEDARVVLRLIRPRAGVGARLGRWVRGRAKLDELLADLWRRWRLCEDSERDKQSARSESGGVELGPILSQTPIELGHHALLGPAARLERRPTGLSAGTWLVRDGVLLVDLRAALQTAAREASVVIDVPSGWIDCPSLRLTADERSVARDANFDLLLAWIHDYAARQDKDGQVAWPLSPFVDDNLPEPVRERAPGLRSASGRPVTREQLLEEIRRGRELVYVWHHQARQVPAYARARILAPWPSELTLLRQSYPDARLIPLQALSAQTDLDPEDLTSLRGGSHEPLVLARQAVVVLPKAPAPPGPPVAGKTPGPERVRIDIEAYVHRSQTATMGFISILAYERRVAQITDRVRVFSGLTLLCRVSPDADSPDVQLDVAALRRNHLAISAIADACRARTLEHWEALISHVMTRARPWETPLLRGALDQLGPASLELGYRVTELAGGAAPRLGWRDTALLDVTVGKTAVDDQLRTLRDALRLLRDRGVIVIARDDRQFPGLRSDDPQLQPWQIPSWSRPLLERVLGRLALLQMPAVPEAYPLVEEPSQLAEDQRHLVRGRADVAADLERARVDPLARLRLLGQLLVARALGLDSAGLEGAPLLERYDPRAMSTTQLVSLSAALAETPRPRLVPVGAVHRGLPRPVIEATPGLAALLVAVAGLEIETGTHEPGATIVEDGDLRGDAPVRRRARALPPLLAKPVVHPLLVGRLQVAGDASSTGIALWTGGLRQRELNLPEPLGRVSGRLVQTAAGARANPRQIDQVVTALACELLAEALRQRALLPPIGPQRERLDLFIEYVRAKVRERDSFELAGPLGVAPPEDRGQRVAALRQMSLEAAPLRPLPNRREALLAQVVGQSLAMKVQFDTAMLTWRAANYRRRRPDGTFEVEFGLRNAWVQRGLDEDQHLDPATHRRAALLAGVLVVAEFFHQARQADDVIVGPEHLTVALWRLLQLA